MFNTSEMLTQRAIFALTSQGHAESAIPDACHTSSGLQLFQVGCPWYLERDSVAVGLYKLMTPKALDNHSENTVHESCKNSTSVHHVSFVTAYDTSSPPGGSSS